VKVAFSLRVKLVLVVSSLLVLSQALLVAIVWFMFSTDFGRNANETTAKTNQLALLVTRQFVERNGALPWESVEWKPLREFYESGAWTSYLKDSSGKIVVHPAQEEQGKIENFAAPVFSTESAVPALGASVVTFIPREVVFEGIDATTRRNIYFAVGVLSFTILFVWFFSGRLSEPLERLRDAVQKIDDGYYNIALKPEGNDETELLTEHVVSMSRVLVNFERFTNKYVARRARKGELPFGGAVKQATIFFSDIRSFTAISEAMDADDVVRFLNGYMDRMVSCVMASGGAIDKFIGDAVFAHWGAVDTTGTPESDAAAALRSALMMRASLASFNITRGSRRRPVIRIGMGLNSGTVVAGQIGSGDRVEFTIIGDAVSLADRTETFNKPFGTEILITENTRRLAGEKFIYEKMPALKNGDGSEINLYAVVNFADGEEAEEAIASLNKMNDIDEEVSRRCLGREGPQNLAQVRELFGIPAPDLDAIDTGEEEKKYRLAKNPPEEKPANKWKGIARVEQVKQSLVRGEDET
jgi:adenylate cyclase